MVSENPAFQRILEEAEKLTDEDQVALAYTLLRSKRFQGVEPTKPRPSFEAALGIGQGDGPAPTDEQVKLWIDEHRMEKYGK